MADLISREALIAEINRIGGHWLSGWDTAGVLSLASRISAVDAVEVVRCEDCDVPHNKWTGCPMLNGLVTPPDFYCGFGERREENET